MSINRKLGVYHTIGLMLFISLIFGLVFFYKKQDNLKKELDSKDKLFQETVYKKNSSSTFLNQKAFEYCKKDQQILSNLTLVKGKSLFWSSIFGFKINPFHKDWDGCWGDFTDDGLKIYCDQRPCSTSANSTEGKFPSSRSLYSPDCEADYLAREFPPSVLSHIDILVKEISEDQKKQLNVYRKTPKKKVEYELLEKDNLHGEISYEFTFYSPEELNLNEYFDVIFGPDYSLQFKIKANRLTTVIKDETKFIDFIEKLIDSIQFI